MLSEEALRVEDLKVVYLPYHLMRIRNLFSAPDRKLKPITAIKGITFGIGKGEVVGIVGKNGSGKTTLLRALAGIFSPDEGRIDLHGNRVSLMALGVGFDSELSGRENIVLSGMMLGFSRRTIKEVMQSIIDYSELGEFIDYPVRTYSSGMYSKLAFSITTFLETDIMLIDEVLSVGDAAFQEKSRKKMKELIREKKHTVLIVSHDLGLLEDICDRVIWMKDGRIEHYGPASEVLKRYSDYMLAPAQSELSPEAARLQRAAEEARPVKVRLEACTLCQLDCADCYMRKENSGTVGKGYLTYAHFRQFLDENSYVKEIELSNSGEVFLNPELISILKLAYKRDIDITLGNGVNLNTASQEQLEALVRYRVRYMTVSIDGASREVYGMYRRKGDLDKVLENIRCINRLKKKYHSHSPELTWQFILMKHNEHELGAAEKMADELGMRFFVKDDWGGYSSEGGGEGGDAGKEAAEEPGELPPTPSPSNAFCSQMLLSPQINWDGRLLGCCRVFKEDWGVNVFETHSLEKALQSEPYRSELLRHLGQKTEATADNPCLHCEYRDVKLI